TETCAIPDNDKLTCNSTQYTFTDASFSVSADFTNTGGSFGAATGNIVLGTSISGNVTGGSLDGKKLECTMYFTVDIAKLKADTLSHFAPTCDGSFSCKYDGKDIVCSDLQTDLGNSTLSCS